MTRVSINAPKTPVTAGSNGIAAATLPNVCKMPGPPAPFVPTPLPNIGRSSDSPQGYSTSVSIEGEKVAIRGASFGSKGDIASKGTGGGLVSSNAQGPTKFIAPGSMNVQIEGKSVHLLGDQTLNNCGPSGSPANAATMSGTVQLVSIAEDIPKSECDVCNPKPGSRADTERKSYEDFFSQDERDAFDTLATESPDLVSMLPPKDGQFIRTNQSKVEPRRKRSGPRQGCWKIIEPKCNSRQTAPHSLAQIGLGTQPGSVLSETPRRRLPATNTFRAPTFGSGLCLSRSKRCPETFVPFTDSSRSRL